MTDLELREAVAVKVMGWQIHLTEDGKQWHVYPVFGGGYLVESRAEALFRIPHYESDIAAAWLVVEKMRERGWLFELLDENGKDWRASYFHEPNDMTEWVHSESAPLAICRAALAAMEASDGR